MAMPQPGTQWPPTQYAPALNAIRIDDERLRGMHTPPQPTPQPLTHPTQYNGGIIGATSRAVLGRPHGAKSHLQTYSLPVADQLITAMADYLAGKPPVVEPAPEDTINAELVEALNRLTESDAFAADWWQAVYRAGSLGWVFGRIVWNLDVDPHPWIEWVDADRGMAEYQNGRQVAVQLWEQWGEGKDTYRLVERHTPTQIEYALFKGDGKKLGQQVPFTELPETAHLADVVTRDGTIMDTGTNMVTAHMMGNYRPRQEWRNSPLLRYYATSDTARAGAIFDTINANYSQLQHEVQAARGRLFVSEDLLHTTGPGQGQFFDWWRDIYTVGSGGNPDAPATLEQIQFDMRVQQYLDLINADIMKAVHAMGLSPFTVGLDEQATGQMTATETRARSARTRNTAEAKGRLQRQHLSTIITAYLEMDAALNNYRPPTKPVLVSLPERIDVTEVELADNTSKLFGAGLLSIEAAVNRLHPEWTDEQRAEEVNRLREREGLSTFDPFNVPVDVNPNPAPYLGE